MGVPSEKCERACNDAYEALDYAIFHEEDEVMQRRLRFIFTLLEQYMERYN